MPLGRRKQVCSNSNIDFVLLIFLLVITGKFILKSADKFTGKWRLHVITPGAPIAPGGGRGLMYLFLKHISCILQVLTHPDTKNYSVF